MQPPQGQPPQGPPSPPEWKTPFTRWARTARRSFRIDVLIDIHNLRGLVFTHINHASVRFDWDMSDVCINTLIKRRYFVHPQRFNSAIIKHQFPVPCSVSCRQQIMNEIRKPDPRLPYNSPAIHYEVDESNSTVLCKNNRQQQQNNLARSSQPHQKSRKGKRSFSTLKCQYPYQIGQKRCGIFSVLGAKCTHQAIYTAVNSRILIETLTHHNSPARLPHYRCENINSHSPMLREKRRSEHKTGFLDISAFFKDFPKHTDTELKLFPAISFTNVNMSQNGLAQMKAEQEKIQKTQPNVWARHRSCQELVDQCAGEVAGLKDLTLPLFDDLFHLFYASEFLTDGDQASRTGMGARAKAGKPKTMSTKLFDTWKAQSLGYRNIRHHYECHTILENMILKNFGKYYQPNDVRVGRAPNQYRQERFREIMEGG